MSFNSACDAKPLSIQNKMLKHMFKQIRGRICRAEAGIPDPINMLSKISNKK